MAHLQYSNHIMMVRPSNFGFNEQTAESNVFQTKALESERSEIANHALKEFDNCVLKLKEHGVNVIVMHDQPNPPKPDAIFPNNWVSFHENAAIVTYPMLSENRRIERNESMLEALNLIFKIENRYSFEIYEDESQFLEGTGSMVLDRVNKIAYACLSPRTNIFLLDKFCILMGYQLVSFTSTDSSGKEIYHTNVMLNIGSEYAVVCLDSISSSIKKEEIIYSFKETKKEIIEISMDQMYQFAGNMLQVQGYLQQPYLVMSEQAYQSLDQSQINRLSKYNSIIQCPIHTIEKYGGGSIRCMMCEIFLPKK